MFCNFPFLSKVSIHFFGPELTYRSINPGFTPKSRLWLSLWKIGEMMNHFEFQGRQLKQSKPLLLGYMAKQNSNYAIRNLEFILPILSSSITKITHDEEIDSGCVALKTLEVRSGSRASPSQSRSLILRLLRLHCTSFHLFSLLSPFVLTRETR